MLIRWYINHKMHISIKCLFSWFLRMMPYLIHVFVLMQCFYISIKLFIGEGSFGSYALIIGSFKKLKYFLIWDKGIEVFYFSNWIIVIDLVVQYFYCMGHVPCTLVFWIWWNETLCFLWILYERVLERLLKFLWQFLIQHYFSYMYMSWMIRKSLYKTSERSSTLCHDLRIL